MAQLNLENLSDDIQDESDGDAPLTSFKLESVIPKKTSKSVGSLPSNMVLPKSNPPSAPSKPIDRVETLEEKIARVMAGINMPKNLPAKSPTNLPTTSPFEKFSLATKANSTSSSPVVPPLPLTSDSLSITAMATEQEISEKKRSGSGARIVRPSSNNTLSSLASEDRADNNANKPSLVVRTQQPSSSPVLFSPSEVNRNETEEGSSNPEGESLISPTSATGDAQQSFSRGIAIPPEPATEPEQVPVKKEDAIEKITLPRNPTPPRDSTPDVENPTKTIKGGRIVRGDSPSLALSSSPLPVALLSQTEPSQPAELAKENSVNESLVSSQKVEPQTTIELEEIVEDLHTEPTEVLLEAATDTESQALLPKVSGSDLILPIAPIPIADIPSEVSSPQNSEPIEKRGRSPEPTIKVNPQSTTPTSTQKTSRVFRPTPSNPAPTPTQTITRSKSQDRSRTPSTSSTVSRTKAAPSTPSFTPQQRRIPELPSALSAVGYTATPEASVSSHSNRHNEWSIARRTDVFSTPSHQPLTIPRYNQQLANMFPENQGHDVKVVVRIRPFTVGEIQSGPRRVVSVNGDKLILVNPNAFDANPDAIAAAAAAVSLENMRCNDWAKVFCFDNCFWSYDPTDEGDTYVDQQGIFEEIGSSIADDILKGISTCCFAYGHTSTGKTYTMFGGDELISSRTKESFIESETTNGDLMLHPSAGLIPRVFMDILNRVFSDSEVLQDTKITLSFLEIYQEKIRDCLSPVNNSAELRVREHPALGPYVENLTRVEVESVRDVLELLYRGYEDRSTASTLRNRHSSRSHAIATLELSPADAKDPFASTSSRKTNSSIPPPVHIEKHTHVRCQMVDLAGSEKDFDIEPSTPSRRRHSGESGSSNEKLELKMIRRSLSTLGYIIKALGQGNSPKGLPFRDSILTWLLKDALSGQSKTTMLATISPSHTCYDETLQTLKYAERLCQTIPSSKPGMESTGRVSIHDTIDPELSYAMASEYSKLKQELGGSRPGSVAAKHLLQQTIADPQQRLAKLEPYRANYIEEDVRYQSRGDERYSMVSMSAKKPTRGGNSLSHSYNGGLIGNSNDLLIEQDLKEAYRQLHGKYVELQIELENTRTDRDSMRLDINKLQDSLERAESEKYLGSKSALNDLTLALRSAEAEVNELRGVILRKEETSDRLLGELADERQTRETVERTARAQVTELINRLESLHRQGQIALKESQNWQQEANILQQEKELLNKEIESLKGLLSEKTDEYQKKIHSLEDEVKLSMEHVNSVIKERDRTNAEITLILKEKAEMASREVNLTKRIQELVLEVERAHNESKLKSELEIIKLQRDSLYEMIKQQENALSLQQKQSEVSLKMLHQRQAALDRYEQKYFNENDEINILQENLQKLLNSEGELLQSEVLDGKKLLQMVINIKEKINENNYLKDEIDKLESEKNEIYLKWKECEKKCETMVRDYRESSEQLEHAKKLSIDWETRAHYWQQVAKKTTATTAKGVGGAQSQPLNQSYDSSSILSPTTGVGAPSLTNAMNSLDVNELQSENIRLQDLLTSTRSELENSKRELETSKNEMQKEFSSLWLAVEQLNKLDASKDKTIHELTIERDNAVGDYKDLLKKYKAMKKEYDGLQSELQSIDLNLLDVADHEGIEVSDLLNVVHDHHPHVNNVLKSASASRDRSLPSKSPRQRHGTGGGVNGLYASYNDPYQHQRDSFHDRDSDVVSEPGYFRNTESRNRHFASRGEKRSNQNQRRERSVSPSGARRRTSHQQQASYSNEKVVSSLPTPCNRSIL